MNLVKFLDIFGDCIVLFIPVPRFYSYTEGATWKILDLLTEHLTRCLRTLRARRALVRARVIWNQRRKIRQMLSSKYQNKDFQFFQWRVI